MIYPKAPVTKFIDMFVPPYLSSAKVYTIDRIQPEVKLDQNESPADISPELKKKILDEMMLRNWNRYPDPYPQGLQSAIAEYSQVPNDCVLLAAGSNQLLAVLTNGIVRHAKGKVVIAQPSFPLYEEYCRYYGIAFELWKLNAQLEYDFKNLPHLPDGSVIIFASPNNPVGNTLQKSDFKKLLAENPNSFFIADEAYFEFAQEPYTDLLAEFSNFISVRTFSKALAAAGIRLGYALGHPQILEQIQKMQVPYLLNIFSIQAAECLLRDANAQGVIRSQVTQICSERRMLFESLKHLGDKGGFRVHRSQANFLLMRWENHEYSQTVYQRLKSKGVLIRNVALSPGLSGCLRVSIGLPAENAKFLRTFQEIIQES